MNAHVTVGIVLAAVLASAPSTADERTDAKKLCGEVMLQANSKLGQDEIRLICEATTQPVEVWECAKKRVAQGVLFVAAVDRCKLASK
jgi:hypothetical protein